MQGKARHSSTKRRNTKNKEDNAESTGQNPAATWWQPFPTLLQSPLLAPYLLPSEPAEKEPTYQEYVARLNALRDTSNTLLKLQVERLKLDSSITFAKDEIRKATSKLKSALPILECSSEERSVFAYRITTYEESIVERERSSEEISFDEENPLRPLILVSKPEDAHEYEIDVVASLQKTYINYSNSLVQAAIIRYAKAAAKADNNAPHLPRKAALQCLGAVNKALVEGCSTEKQIDLAHERLYTGRPATDEWYLHVVFNVLNGEDVKRARNTPTRLQIIKSQLLKCVPGEDPDPIIQFLKDTFNHRTSLIRRRFANFEDLRNAYAVYVTGQALSTVKAARTCAFTIIDQSIREQQQLGHVTTIDGLMFLVWRERPKSNKRKK
jgi:hypothetical protein